MRVHKLLRWRSTCVYMFIVLIESQSVSYISLSQFIDYKFCLANPLSASNNI